MIDSHPADGWILFRGSPSLLEWFARRGVRCLNVGPVGKPNPIPSIEIDHEAACADAVRRLADLGHVRIGLLTGPAANGLPNFAERFEAAVQSVPDLSGRILHSDGGRRDLCDRIDPLLAQDPSLSALLCADALTYATAATFLAGRGLSIPSRISLIALRHERFLDALVPLPTAYLIDQVRLGRLVHDSVVDLVDGMARPTHRHRIEPVCRPGESIGRPSKQTVA
jgi:DNA-binding LacI/PurR family transcriptional regulator